MSRKVETFKPLKDKQVTIYTCGPTVYDYPHIGNWFTFVRYDVLVRTLKLSGYDVKWVMNITDVGHLVSDADEGEDKLEKGARREGKTAWEVADYYTEYFINGLRRLNITPPTLLPKATDHIEEQIGFIQKLESKGFTYTIDDGVYFDTSKVGNYGKLANLDLRQLQAGARVELNPQKHNHTDFALWKFSPKTQKRDMEWNSPWGKGFPGWHIECSAMAMKYLGETIDIHGGGIDHIPVHHTNEIAQTESLTGKPFANYWFHTNHISVDGSKISKSLGNSITLEDIEARGFTMMDLRYMILQSNYQTQSKFTWENLEMAADTIHNIRENLSWIYHSGVMATDPIKGLSDDFNRFKLELLGALNKNLGTPEAISLLHGYAFSFIGMPASQLDIPVLEDFAKFIYDLFGIEILDKNYKLPEELQEIIEQREIARRNKNFVLADKLRDYLAEQRIDIRDTDHGPIWFRTR